MAKKRTAKKKATTKRRSVGAAKLNPNSNIVKLGAAVLGYMAADPINKKIDEMVPATTDKKIVGAGQTGVGAALLLMKFGPSTGAVAWVKTIAGGLLAGSGAKRLAKEMKLISGYQQVPVIGRRRMNGYGQVPVIGGYTPNQALNGYTVPRRSSSVMGAVMADNMANAGVGR